MKRIIYLSLIFFFLGYFQEISLSAQSFWVENNMAFDTNGPIGECLFPMDENGETVYKEVVQCQFSRDTLSNILIQFLQDEDEKDNISVSWVSKNIANSNLSCDVEINCGKEFVELPYVGKVERHSSQINFKVLIEVKDGRFRYTLDHFHTNRRTIKGEAKSEGKPNIIHWQRLNSLSKEQAQMRPKSSKYSEWQDQIEKEKQSYIDEYAAVQKFIKEMKANIDNAFKDDF